MMLDLPWKVLFVGFFFYFLASLLLSISLFGLPKMPSSSDSSASFLAYTCTLEDPLEAFLVCVSILPAWFLSWPSADGIDWL